MSNNKRLILIASVIGVIVLIGIITGLFFIMQGLDGKEEDNGKIVLKNGNSVEIYAGETYKEDGYSAVDKDGKDITKRVEVSKPNFNHTGTFTINYQCKADDGSLIRAERKVNVVLKPADEAYRKSAKGLPILMYHNVYDEANPPSNINSNFISSRLLEEHIKLLLSENYFFPTWSEVRDYVDGKIQLPEKSVVMSFDDGTEGFRSYGVPLIEKYDVQATAFIITSHNGKMWASENYPHITLQSHSDNMHRPGGKIGHGGILTALSEDEIVADLKKSSEILGTDDAFAYPFGDFLEENGKAVEKAGFKVAVTTKYGKVFPGDNPYFLKRVRVNGGTTAAALSSAL